MNPRDTERREIPEATASTEHAEDPKDFLALMPPLICDSAIISSKANWIETLMRSCTYNVVDACNDEKPNSRHNTLSTYPC